MKLKLYRERNGDHGTFTYSTTKEENRIVREATNIIAAWIRPGEEVPFDAAGMLEVGRQCRENPACDFNDEEEQL